MNHAQFLSACLAFAVFVLMCPSDVLAEKVPSQDRALWTTSKILGTPEPPDPYQPEVAFPFLKFNEPLAISALPNTNRFIVAERGGKVWAFENHPLAARRDLVLDIGPTVMGLTVHPKFASNGHIYVTHIEEVGTGDDAKKTVHVKRFTITDQTTLKADRTATQIIQWPADGHTGGCMRFGPDGYLYIAVGDSSGIADALHTGQDISDLAGSILRIDVDHPDGERAYSVPKDNPFVGRENTRPEIWSYGHRQPWRFSFDRKGNLWACEVGQDLWEMVNLIQKGGNYGWSVMEGSHPFRPERPKGPTDFIKPIVEHPHTEARSLTGGYVYYADRLKELQGAYIYADYDTGKMWSLRFENGKVTDHRVLADTQLRTVTFGQGVRGEVFMVDFAGGYIHQLVPAPPPVADGPTFPTKLSDTGLFTSTKDYTPQPGLIPYSVNSPLWSDHAEKDRFIALPGKSQIEFDVVTYPQPAPGAPPGWRFPDNTVLVKTFSLEMETGNPESRRRLETRILHHKKMPGIDDEYGAQFWRGYTYIWNDEQTDAFLADAKGVDQTFTIKDANAEGGQREQAWHFPSRDECTLCHTMSAKYVLGVNTLQMNRDHDYGDGKPVNQLTQLQQLGIFATPPKETPDKLPRLVDYRDKSASIDDRARSYLHSNCAHCHRKWGGGNADFQLLSPLPLADTGTVNVKPGQGKFKLNDPRNIIPGDPSRSMVYHRMTLKGLGRMPHIASKVVHEEAVQLIGEWIKQLPDK